MYKFFSKNIIFLTIIIGAVIIGWFVYFGLQRSEVVVAPESQTIPAQNSTPEIKTDLILDTASCGVSENTIVSIVIAITIDNSSPAS